MVMVQNKIMVFKK